MKSVCLLVCLGVWCSAVQAVDYDAIVDKVVDGIKQKLIEEKLTQVPLPDYQKFIYEKILFFQVQTTLNLTGIKVSDFSTMRRRTPVDPSEVTYNADTGVVNIMADFSLDDLTVSVDSFKYDMPLFHIDRQVNIQINSNQFTFSVYIKTNRTTGECSSHLIFSMVDRLEDFSVTLGDSGFFSPAVERVDNIYLDWIAPSIDNAVDYYIKPLAEQVVQTFSQEICQPFL